MGVRLQSTYEKDFFYGKIGNAIREARERANVGQRGLAETCNLTLGTIQSAEQGLSCSMFTCAKIAEALDLTLDDLCPVDALR